MRIKLSQLRQVIREVLRMHKLMLEMPPGAEIPPEAGGGQYDRQEIVGNMVKAFFADAWANWNDEHGDTNVSGMDIMDVMPDEMDPSAVAAGNKLATEMEQLNGMSLPEIMTANEGVAAGDRPYNEEMFGHYATMSALGHGVGLWDAFGDEVDTNVKLPDMSWGVVDLDPGKYPMPGDNGDVEEGGFY